MNIIHFYILVSVLSFILGTFLFVKGYRDADMALNMVIVKEATSVEFVDTSLFGKTFTILDLYKIGIAELFASFILFFTSLGFSLIAGFKAISDSHGSNKP